MVTALAHYALNPGRLSCPGHPLTAATQTQYHALATGFSQAFLVSAAVGLLALIIPLAAIRVTARTCPAQTRRRRPPTERAGSNGRVLTT